MSNPIKLLSYVIQTPGALPPLFWGQPGIGKSQRITHLARRLSWGLETVIASIRDQTDFAGLPIPSNGNGVAMEPPSWAHRARKAADDGKHVLVFLDEVSCAPPAVQAALLRPVLEGFVGDLELPRRFVHWVAAANPPEEAAGGWDLAPPLANRWTHLTWPAPSAESWADWLCGTGEEDPVPHLDLEAFERARHSANALVSAFVRRKPGCLAELTSKLTGRFPLAFATPRSWDSAARLLATCRVFSDLDSVLPLVAGNIGEPVAIEFAAFARENDLPDPEDLLAKPESWKPDARRPDQAFAVVTAVATCAVAKDANAKRSKKEVLERWCAAWRVIDRGMALGKDTVILGAKTLAQRDNRPDGGAKRPEVEKVVSQLKDVIQMANA